ncbi:unnamed protein product [Urochloa decumbens]|uniref:Uncharacterized protein n=1 Tax=Urochloa decumbens TaxID=240449 RepID=A0ABC9C1S3_9POAL
MSASLMKRSICTPVTKKGSHVFEIAGYSTYKCMDSDFFINSGTFSVGGHNWYIRFQPNVVFVNAGVDGAVQHCISVHLVLHSKGAKVRASCDLSLVDKTTGSPWLVLRMPEPREFKYGDTSMYFPESAFMDHAMLEASPAYLRDDRLVIQCDVTVIKDPRLFTNKFVGEVEPPPSNIAGHLGTLFETGVGADVTFTVEGETFAAHKVILAARSPVLMAELFGPMKEARMQHLTVEDMHPDVFRAMLHFIYTDDLPNTDEIWRDHDNKMIQHLLVAANRYDVDRLKSICQGILCDRLDVENVAATLVLAYHHNSPRLMKFCIRLISDPKFMEAVKETAGYRDLKTNYPDILADLFEVKTSNLHKK